MSDDRCWCAGIRSWSASSISAGNKSPCTPWPSRTVTTDPLHQHSPYRRVIQRNLDYLLDRARLIGKQTGTWAEAMIEQRGPIGTRVLHGLLSLAGKHPVAALEAAAEKALHHGTWRLRDLRTLLERAGPSPQLDFLETHPLIRSLDAYEALTPDCFNPQPKTVYEPT